MRQSFCALLVLGVLTGGTLRADTVEFRDGDRVILLGSTFIERAQRYGYIEAELTAALAGQGKSVTFRNLGWSGDTVWADSRGIFDPPAEGYKRMIAQVKELEPTLIFLYYGANEAFAGQPGLKPFLTQYEKLLDDLAPTKARVVLVSPIDHLKFSDLHPNPAIFNRKAAVYRDAIRDLAKRRKLAFVDLTGPLGEKSPLGSPDNEAAVPSTLMTDTGVHPNALGYMIIAEVFSRAVLGEPKTVATSVPASGEAVTVEFPRVLYPGDIKPAQIFKITGLKPGRYTLQCDGDDVMTFDNNEWAKGIPAYLIDYERFEDLREAIVEKNRLYFYRWRPQNVTYLYLFRKHEQGNNAAEIPKFDPLVAAKEKEIKKLSHPVKHTLKLVRERSKE